MLLAIWSTFSRCQRLIIHQILAAQRQVQWTWTYSASGFKTTEQRLFCLKTLRSMIAPGGWLYCSMKLFPAKWCFNNFNAPKNFRAPSSIWSARPSYKCLWTLAYWTQVDPWSQLLGHMLHVGQDSELPCHALVIQLDSWIVKPKEIFIHSTQRGT